MLQLEEVFGTEKPPAAIPEFIFKFYGLTWFN